MTQNWDTNQHIIQIVLFTMHDYATSRAKKEYNQFAIVFSKREKKFLCTQVHLQKKTNHYRIYWP